jgi:hypothetical protein
VQQTAPLPTDNRITSCFHDSNLPRHCRPADTLLLLHI